MPPPRSHRAPYFSGRVGDPIEDFLSEYEELASSCGLTSRQKVEIIVRYIPLELRDLWKSLDGYLAGDWQDLRLTLEEIYESTSALSRHSEQKLQDFIRHSSKSHMNDEGDVLHYYCQFLLLSKPLLDSQRLTNGERNKAFWHGFHSRDQAEMYARLIAKHPDQPSGVHFDYLDIYKVARATFSGDHLLDLELDDPWEGSRSLKNGRLERTQTRRADQDEHDPRGADPNYRSFERWHHPSPDHPPRHRSPPPETNTRVVHLKKPAHEEEDPEMEELMERMHGLSVREKAYGVLYAQCAHRYPSVAQCLPKPIPAPYAPISTPVTANTFSLQTPAPPPLPSRQPWAPVANLPAPHPTSNPPSVPQITDPSVFFRPRVRAEGCSFCLQPGHRVCECPTAQEYVRSGHTIIIGERLHLPNGQPIPNDGTGRGLKNGIDSWLAAQPQVTPALAQQVAFMREAPPHLPTTFDNHAPSARIEDVMEAHIVQVVSTGQAEEDSDPDDEDALDIFQVFAAEKKKRETRRAKMPELHASHNTTPAASVPAPLPLSGPAVPAATPIPPTPAIVPAPAAQSSATANRSSAVTTQHTAATSGWPAPQYWYQSSAEDQYLVSELQSWLMQGKLAHATPAHVLAASPTIRKELADKLRVQRVEASSYEEAAGITFTDTSTADQNVLPTNLCKPAYSLPLREIDIQIADQVTEAGIVDLGSQIVVIRKDLAQQVGATINTHQQLEMEGANGATNWTLGCAKYLPMHAGGIQVLVHAHVVENAPFCLLLGRPFQHALLCRIEDFPNGDVEVSVCDPNNPSHRVSIPSRPRKVQVASVRISTLSYHSLSPTYSTSLSISPFTVSKLSPPSPQFSSLFYLLSTNTSLSVQAYKKVAKKVCPVPASLPEDFRIIRRIPSDPLLTLTPLPIHPPDFSPGL